MGFLGNPDAPGEPTKKVEIVGCGAFNIDKDPFHGFYYDAPPEEVDGYRSSHGVVHVFFVFVCFKARN